MGRVPFDEQAWLAGPAASRVATGEEGFTTLERIGARPTAEVNGLWGGYTGPGHKTIIPAEAHAKVTFRLVADQRPEDVAAQVRAWVEANLPEGIEADVHCPPGGVAPVRQRPRLARGWTRCCGPSPRPSTPTRTTSCSPSEGGSGPEADLVESLGAPLIFLGAGLPDRPHPLAERAGAAADAPPRRGGGGAPVARARRACAARPGCRRRPWPRGRRR